MIRVRVAVSTVVLGFVGVLLMSAAAEAQRGGGPSMRESAQKRMTDENYADIHGRGMNGAKWGEMAPDFELMPLKFYEFGIDEADITEENAGNLYQPVRLSDFRGKKPVVLIFGSYT